MLGSAAEQTAQLSQWRSHAPRCGAVNVPDLPFEARHLYKQPLTLGILRTEVCPYLSHNE